MSDLVEYPALDGKHAEFWIRFQQETGHTGTGPRYVDVFGDRPEMNDALLALVLSRTKQATASLLRWTVPRVRIDQLVDF